MASEGIPAPGAIISLITLQKIRYEGRLVNIDMANSTLKLEDIKSYGTEDRSEQWVPPQMIPEAIVFYAKDILSLDVVKHAAPTTPLAPQEQHAPPPQQYQQQPDPWAAPPAAPQPNGSAWGPPIQSRQPSVPSNQPQPSAPPAPPTGNPPPAPAPTVVVTPSMAPRPQQPQRPTQAPQPRQPAWANARPPQNASAQPRPPGPNAPPGVRPPPGQPRPPPPADYVTPGPPPGFGAPPPQSRPPPPTSYASAAGVGNGHAPRGRGRGRDGGGRGREGGGRDGGRVLGAGREGGRGTGPPRPPPVPVPNEDFNFQEALSKFDKGKLREEAAEKVDEEIPVVPVAYNKDDDFFDALSSDVMNKLTTGERPSNRGRFAEQRKVDQETFGGSGMARRPQGRGRGRGRGNPGGRGGRGGRNHGRGPPQSAVAAA